MLSAVDDLLDPGDGKGVGIDQTLVSVDSSMFVSYSEPLLLNMGTHTLRFYSKDLKGNNEPVKTILVSVDGTAPQIVVNSPSGSERFIAKQNKIRISFSVTDNFDTYPSSSAFIVNATKSVSLPVLSGQEIEPLRFRPGSDIDGERNGFCGNTASTTTATFEVVHDTLPPRTTMSLSGAQFEQNGNTYIGVQTGVALAQWMI